MDEMSDTWVKTLEHVAQRKRDIVDILREACKSDPRFGAIHVRAALCVRKVFDLDLRQMHCVAAWLDDELTDAELRAAIPLEHLS